jgi:predicted small lipoprotein YifL
MPIDSFWHERQAFTAMLISPRMRFQKSYLRYLFIALSVACLLSACGLKGPLYLPTQKPAATTPPAATGEPADAKKPANKVEP